MSASTGVTFTRTAATYDATGGGVAPVETTITGNAFRTTPRTRLDLMRYESLGLVQSDAPTLLFAPTTYGETPAPGDVVTWNSIDYTVRSVDPVAPDGVTIIARVVISR